MTPTARSLAECRKRGWICQVVEHWNQWARKKHDLFGCIDIVAITPDGVLGIQATSGDNHAARRTKTLQEPRIRAWLDAGARFAVWSWRKGRSVGKRSVWQLREELIVPQDYTIQDSDDVR